MKTTPFLAARLLGGALFGTVALTALAPAALAQDADHARRLERLEMAASALRGDGVPLQVAENGLPPSLAADFEVRLQRLERSISELTGRNDEVGYQLSQLKDRLERINSDIEYRLNQVESGKAGALSAVAPPPGKTADAKPPEKPGTLPSAAVKPADAKPADAKAPDTKTQTAALPAGASPEKQYEYAFALLRDQDYDKAEKALVEFLAKNKGHDLAGNAQYWLGETYYVRRKYQEAAVAFAEGVQKYPKNSKAADNLLKLGMAMAQLEKKNEACVAFGQLTKKFPDAAASVKRRAETERRRLNCPG